MLGSQPFQSPMSELCYFESSTMQFQWSGNSYMQTGHFLRDELFNCFATTFSLSSDTKLRFDTSL